jgi:hypothetical protein
VPRNPRRIVSGTKHPFLAVEKGKNFTLLPYVITGGKDIGTGSKKPVGDLGSNSETVGGILTVHDHKIGPALLCKRFQSNKKSPASRLAEDITEKQDRNFIWHIPLPVSHG